VISSSRDDEDTVPVISIVDDDPSIGRALRRVLQSSGYAVEVFTSACEFLASAPLGRTACLVLDIRLAGMTGLELQERLAACGSTIPVIFITAHDDAPTRARVQQAGAAGFLPKPFAAAALLAAVERAAGPA
jgi:FixJ family two-component response regulator